MQDTPAKKRRLRWPHYIAMFVAIAPIVTLLSIFYIFEPQAYREDHARITTLYDDFAAIQSKAQEINPDAEKSMDADCYDRSTNFIESDYFCSPSIYASQSINTVDLANSISDSYVRLIENSGKFTPIDGLNDPYANSFRSEFKNGTYRYGFNHLATGADCVFSTNTRPLVYRDDMTEYSNYPIVGDGEVGIYIDCSIDSLKNWFDEF